MNDIKVTGDTLLCCTAKKTKNSVIYALNWNLEAVTPESKVVFEWKIPINDLMYRWYPDVGELRHIPPSWRSGITIENSIAFNAPVISFLNHKGISKYTVALSEYKKLSMFDFGINEFTGELDCKITLPLFQFTGADSTVLEIRIDEEPKPLEEAIDEIRAWWEADLEIMQVPEALRDSFYSFWCSYHRTISPEVVEAECRLVKELGIKAVIVDDGWQTLNPDAAEGYSRCGDWKPLKFPDMAKHVERVHQMGLKYVLWYSVPYIGDKAEMFESFKDKLLYKNFSTYVLDPRYKEVRDYLINKYRQALIDWNLDGFKLDFIDKFKNVNHLPATDEMDIKDLYDAVFALMTDIKKALQAVKPDVLLEFRQLYVGPAMRSFGNFFRAEDCPYDYVRNKIRTIDLRLLSGNTAVHSDMLMWHNDEKTENCALQMINILFSTMQLSVKLGEQRPEQIAAIKFWLKFMRDNKNALLKSRIKVYDSHNLYTLAEGIEKDKKVSVLYTAGKVIKADRAEVIIVNGTQEASVFAACDGSYTYKTADCMGNMICENQTAKNICEIPVPPSGVIWLTKMM